MRAHQRYGHWKRASVQARYYLKRNKYADQSKIVTVYNRFGQEQGVRVKGRHGWPVGDLISSYRP